MAAIMSPYNAAHAVGSSVRIAARAVLDGFAKTWKLHNPLISEQLAFAGWSCPYPTGQAAGC